MNITIIDYWSRIFDSEIARNDFISHAIWTLHCQVLIYLDATLTRQNSRHI